MFWRSGETPGERGEEAGSIVVQPDAARPATILRVAGELEERGGEIVELFKEIRSPHGQVVLPIHLLTEGRDVFVEVETKPWYAPLVEETLNKIVVLRGSDHAEAGFEILSAYPVPREVEFLSGLSPAAVFQLDLLPVSLERPADSARLFCEAATRHWDVDLAYETGYLPLVEQLLMAVLEGEDGAPPILDALVVGLGSFVGETIRCNAGGTPGSWLAPEDWSEGPVLEIEKLALDPVGKARAFLEKGPEDSVAFYADYVLEEIVRSPRS